jgi:hypothetical protein
MPRDGAIIFGDLIGKLDVLRIECAKCGRSGRYRLTDLLMRYGRNGKVFAFTEDVTGNCTRKQARSDSDLCAPRSHLQSMAHRSMLTYPQSTALARAAREINSVTNTGGPTDSRGRADHDNLACNGRDRCAGFRQDAREHRPDMEHARPYFEFDLAAV